VFSKLSQNSFGGLKSFPETLKKKKLERSFAKYKSQFTCLFAVISLLIFVLFFLMQE